MSGIILPSSTLHATHPAPWTLYCTRHSAFGRSAAIALELLEVVITEDPTNSPLEGAELKNEQMNTQFSGPVILPLLMILFDTRHEWGYEIDTAEDALLVERFGRFNRHMAAGDLDSAIVDVAGYLSRNTEPYIVGDHVTFMDIAVFAVLFPVAAQFEAGGDMECAPIDSWLDAMSCIPECFIALEKVGWDLHSGALHHIISRMSGEDDDNMEDVEDEHVEEEADDTISISQ
ncbi:hypothetical protein BJX64DRAFT_285771 [Aspergillus heterothallicus]